MINGISSTTSTSAVSGVHHHRRGGPGGQDPMTAVADALGMTTDELHQALDNGSTMNSLAETRGVSHDDLIVAIKQGLPNGGQTQAVNGADAAADVDEIAESIASGKGPKRPAGPPPGGGGRPPMGVNRPDTDTAQKVADLLGTTTDDLYDQLSSGTSLSQLASNANVSESQLLETMSSGMFFKIAM